MDISAYLSSVTRVLDKERAGMLEAERYLWKNPETGYKEYKSHAYMKACFEGLGYEVTEAEGITGFFTVVDTKRDGPELLILAELDAVICETHPERDPETGAVHACGHNAQCAAMLGIAAALKDEAVLSQLSGRIRLCLVPAEELLEIEYRRELMKQGKIRYFGGKTEYLYRGYFDSVDLAFMVHTANRFTARTGGSVGCIAKNVIYKGRAAHAGGSPHLGCNALYAANCGLSAVNALRETFREKDLIRVHPIVTAGGAIVNAIPDCVTIESYVRGRTVDAIKKANDSVNRALIGAALSLGANVEIIDMPGYAPHINAKDMVDVYMEACRLALPEGVPFAVAEEPYTTASTDMGDLSCVMPIVHPYCGGAVGHAHGNDYYMEDPEQACVLSARVQLAMLALLMGDGAREALRIVESFKPPFESKEAFFAYQESIRREGDCIRYNGKTAEVLL